MYFVKIILNRRPLKAAGYNISIRDYIERLQARPIFYKTLLSIGVKNSGFD